MMKTNKTVNKILKIVLLISLVVGTGFTCLYPIPEYAGNMWLQHIGTLLLLIPLLYDSIKNRLPLLAYICLACFTVLHIVGARYIYSYVPYQEWLSAIGINSDLFTAVMDFGTKSRHSNQYDRLVHFAFGVLMFPCLLHITKKWVGQKPLVAILFSWLFIQAFSMIYEIFEWQLSVWCDGGDAYNGQQGDIWDAQKDMALAMIGSTIMAVFYSCKKRCLAAVTSVTVLGGMTGCVMVPVGRGAAGPDLAEAQCALGVMYAEGQGVAKDDVVAVRWFELAADQGSVKAQHKLGVMYEQGRGVVKDDAEAVRWYQKAAEQGCAEAQCALGVMYAEGRGVTKDDAEAACWYQKAAEQGCTEAQLNLGVMCYEGQGVAKDGEDAVRWFRMAADKGDANAQYILGVLHEERPVIVPAMLVFIFPGLLHGFENVEGVARDDAMAVFWYRKAAEQGHAAAQFRLGQMFAAGRCVKEDEFASVRWYQKAARQGNADAQKALRDRGIAW